MPLDPHAPCTVCIPTYNQAEYLHDAVLSVVAQTAPVRLLVSNDASPDHTAEVLAGLQAQYGFRAENHTTNRGISANLEWLLRQAETPLIVRLDSDDLLHERYVERLSALLAAYPQAGYAHCAVREIDAAGTATGERRLARKTPFQEADTALRRAVNGYQVTANILMFRRDALAATDFAAGSAHLNFVEDYDLSVRLADAGWGNVYDPEVLASYRMWSAASRPAAGRKLREVQGVRHIFTGSLTSAFQRRGWPTKALARRRAQLALMNAEILDREPLSPAERAAMVQALMELGGETATVRLAVQDTALGRLVRQSLQRGATARQAGKRLIKAALFR